MEHPDVSKLRRFGVPADDNVECPMCGSEAETFYRKNGVIIGCEDCIESVDWSEIQC